MKTVLACLLFAVAIVATVALLPASRWILLNQVDLFSHHEKLSPYEEMWQIEPFIPSWTHDSRTYIGKSFDERFAEAFFTDTPRQLSAMEDFSNEFPNDATGLSDVCKAVAHVLKLDNRDYYSEKHPNTSSQVTIIRLGLKASFDGARLEPDNAFFPFMKAEFDRDIGHYGDLATAIAEAARKARFDDHQRDECLRLERAQRSAKGYRGELIRTAIDGSVDFEDNVSLAALSYIDVSGSLVERRDLVQTLYAMGKGVQVDVFPLTLLLAEFRYAVWPNDKADSLTRHDTTGSILAAKAAAFDQQLTSAGIPTPKPSSVEILKTLRRLSEATSKYFRPDSSIYNESGPSQPSRFAGYIVTVGPYAAIATLALSLVLSWAASLFNLIKLESVRDVLPNFACLAVWAIVALSMRHLTDPMFARPGIPTEAEVFHDLSIGMLFGAGQAILALLRMKRAFEVFPLRVNAESWSRIPTIGGIVLAATAPLSGSQSAAYGGLAYAVALGLLWKDRDGNSPRATQVLTVILGVLACAGVGIWFTVDGSFYWCFGRSVVTTGLVGLTTGSLFTFKPARLVRTFACTSMVLFSLAYLVTCGIQVRENRREMMSKTKIVDLGDNIRREAGLMSR